MGEQDLADIQARMLQRATARLIEQGMEPEPARVFAEKALSAPSLVHVPTIEELEI